MTRASWLVLTLVALSCAIWLHAAWTANSLDVAHRTIADLRATVEIRQRGLDRGDRIEWLEQDISDRATRGLCERINATAGNNQP
jgi:hypothetical protein